MVSDLVGPKNVDAAVRALADLEMTSATELPAIPGAGQLLATLTLHRWAAVTSGHRGMALKRLISAGLPHPPVLISAEDVSRGKPAPDPYLAGAAQSRLSPQRCAVFEDARRASMPRGRLAWRS
ncbi:hypothetical protein BH11ACT6_BH11ACT6_04720 [soil metagenome]